MTIRDNLETGWVGGRGAPAPRSAARYGRVRGAACSGGGYQQFVEAAAAATGDPGAGGREDDSVPGTHCPTI